MPTGVSPVSGPATEEQLSQGDPEANQQVLACLRSTMLTHTMRHLMPDNQRQLVARKS